MDRISGVQLFIRIVETGSFSKASADLGVTQPTATKHVAALEAQARRAAAEPQHARRQRDRDRRALLREVQGDPARARRGRQPRGAAAVAGRRAAAHQHLGRVRPPRADAAGARASCARTPRSRSTSASTIATSTSSSKASTSRSAWAASPTRRSARATSALNPWVLVASPGYLAQHAARRDAGRPEPPRLPGLQQRAGRRALALHRRGGQRRGVDAGARAAALATTCRRCSSAARAGLGPRDPAVVRRARRRCADGSVRPLLTDHTLPAQEMHAVFPSPKLVPSKVSSFIGYLQEQFTPDWWKTLPPQP